MIWTLLRCWSTIKSLIFNPLFRVQSKKGSGSKLFIGTWTDGNRNQFLGRIAALQIWKDIPVNVENRVDAKRSTAEWHIKYKYEKLRRQLYLGAPDGPMRYDRYSGCHIQKYQRGDIMYKEGVGAFEIHGAIRERYHKLSNTLRRNLGFLVSDEIVGSRRHIRKSVFQKGCIYWSARSGAFEVYGQMYLDYERLGAGSSAIGLPVQSQTSISGGRRQVFQYGRMYMRNGQQAFEVHGAILQRYIRLGEQKMGFPLTNEMDVKKRSRVIGKVSEFEKCTIYWSSRSGAYEVHGTIRQVYHERGGPQGSLGFPTSNESKVPRVRGAGQYNTFQQGTIVWFGSRSRTYVCRPFDIFLRTIATTKDHDGFGAGEDDMYAYVTLKKNGHVYKHFRLPERGDYGGRLSVNVNRNIPNVMNPNSAKDWLELRVKVWDKDDGFEGSDDFIGEFVYRLDITNAWGLTHNNGSFSDSRARDLKLSWAVRHKRDRKDYSKREWEFWNFTNKGTNPLSFQQYMRTFRNIKSDNPKWYRPIQKYYYEWVYKTIAKSGNCFGISLETIYAWKCMSIFSKPLINYKSFSGSVKNEINIKHGYQVGDAALYWFVNQFVRGKTHDPKHVFLRSRQCFSQGNHPVICFSDKSDYSGSNHCVTPYRWDTSKKPWKIFVYENNLNFSSFNSRIKSFQNASSSDDKRNGMVILVDPDRNTFSYRSPSGRRHYTGTSRSGGRLMYFPWNVLNHAPRVPDWEIFLLLMAGTLLIFGDEAESLKLKSSNGKNLDGRKARAGDRLTDMFAPVVPTDGQPNGACLLQMGKGMNNSFSHELKGKRNASFQYAIGNMNDEYFFENPIRVNEKQTVETKNLGSAKPILNMKVGQNKLVDLVVVQSMGVGGDQMKLSFKGIPASRLSKLQVSPKPGLEGVDIMGSSDLKDVPITIETMIDRKYSVKKFNASFEKGFRMRPASVINSNTINLGKIDKLNGVLRESKIIKGN